MYKIVVVYNVINKVYLGWNYKVNIFRVDFFNVLVKCFGDFLIDGIVVFWVLDNVIEEFEFFNIEGIIVVVVLYEILYNYGYYVVVFFGMCCVVGQQDMSFFIEDIFDSKIGV